jgi:hypothetical protein
MPRCARTLSWEESVAEPIGESDEVEALLGTEPLDDAVDRDGRVVRTGLD